MRKNPETTIEITLHTNKKSLEEMIKATHKNIIKPKQEGNFGKEKICSDRSNKINKSARAR